MGASPACITGSFTLAVLKYKPYNTNDAFNRAFGLYYGHYYGHAGFLFSSYKNPLAWPWLEILSP